MITPVTYMTPTRLDGNHSGAYYQASFTGSLDDPSSSHVLAYSAPY